MINNKMAALTVFALTFGVAACGGGDDGGSEAAADSPLAEALAADMLADSDGTVATEEEAECWAGGVVSKIGEDRLRELGMSETNVADIDELGFTSDEVTSIVDSMFECVDVKAMFASQFESEMGAEAANCLAEGLDEQFVKEMIEAEFDGSEPSDEFMQNFLDIAAECDIPLN